MKRLLFFWAALALVLIQAACGGDDGGSSGQGGSDPTPPAFSAKAYPVDDGQADCFAVNQPVAVSCQPIAMDIKRLILDENESGFVVVGIEMTGDVDAIGDFTMRISFDTDRNKATGDTSFAAYHGMGVDLELAFIVQSGQPPHDQARLFEAGGQRLLTDASQVEWREIAEVGLQVTISPNLVDPKASMLMDADITVGDRFDQVPDFASVALPQHEVVPAGR